MDIYNIIIHCHQCSKLNKVLIWNDREKHYCNNCGELLFKTKKPEGIIYVLSNKNMPELVKIGMTRDSIKNRVRQLSSATGVPGKFIVEAWFVSNKPEIEENKIHQKLSRKREWSEHFRINTGEAIDAIIKILNGREPVYRRKSKIIENKQNKQSQHNDNSTHASATKQFNHKPEQYNLFDNALNKTINYQHNNDSIPKQPKKFQELWNINKAPTPFEPCYITWTCPKCLREYKILLSKDTAMRQQCPYCPD